MFKRLKNKKGFWLPIPEPMAYVLAVLIVVGHYGYTHWDWGSEPTKHLDQEITGNAGNFVGGYMLPQKDVDN